MKQQIKVILSKMTLEDKISLCNGADFWHSKAMEQYGIPAFAMCDGPHGVRVQKADADMFGLNESEPSTCFPAAVTSGASWDAALLELEGRSIGEEGLSLGTDVVLGPGVNIKRDPRCGRCFEYFSEDPFLAGADAPLRSTVLSGGKAFPANIAEGLLAMANGHPLQGLKKMGGK